MTADDQVTFVLSGKDREITLQAQIADGYATAQLEQDSLTALGRQLVRSAYISTIQWLIRSALPSIFRSLSRIPMKLTDSRTTMVWDTMLTKNWATNKGNRQQHYGSAYPGITAMKANMSHEVRVRRDP